MQYFLAYARPHGLRGEWEFNYFCHRFMHGDNERHPYSGGFTFVIPRSLTKLFIGFS